MTALFPLTLRQVQVRRQGKPVLGPIDLTLDSGDQRLAATFFSDPHRAQVIRQSDNSGHERFWKRYKQFGANAESYCRSVSN